MPAISLVICVYREEDLLARLLERAEGTYDDLVVIHDGPAETDDIPNRVAAKQGRFFIRPRAYQEEYHWPFAWGQARSDWILKFDADEYPSDELREWIRSFRRASDPPASHAGYTCLWPLWNGRRTVTRRYPVGRQFLFHRHRVRFIGIAEQGIMADGEWQAVPWVLHHQPKRKSYGWANVVWRPQAYIWRRRIVQALMAPPTEQPCWRWTDSEWPLGWEQIRRRPLWTGLKRLIKYPLKMAVDMVRHREWPRPGYCFMPGIHHALIGLEYWRMVSRCNDKVSS